MARLCWAARVHDGRGVAGPQQAWAADACMRVAESAGRRKLQLLIAKAWHLAWRQARCCCNLLACT